MTKRKAQELLKPARASKRLRLLKLQANETLPEQLDVKEVWCYAQCRDDSLTENVAFGAEACKNDCYSSMSTLEIYNDTMTLSDLYILC